MPKLDEIVKQYDYNIPEELIAQKPAKPRDSARLLILKKSENKVYFDTFKNLAKYIPKNAVLVFNQTKVLPARLIVKKETGGKAKILYIDNDKTKIKVIADRKLTVGQKLFLGKTSFLILNQEDNFYFLKPAFPISKIKDILKKYGETPLPPYIKKSPLTEAQRKIEYQSVFARQGLSVAAPTASLHFSKKLLSNLKKEGIGVKFVTLNVNLGTFAPLNEENIKNGSLHLESYNIDSKTANELNKAKSSGRMIIAVGTTVIRTLESASENFKLTKLSGQTDLFIRPGFKFQFIDGAVTNFHVPKSSLMMLIAAITGRKKLLNAYEAAIKNRLRFFSFGDGMIILP